MEKLSTIEEIKDEIKLIRSLEGIVELNDEWMIDFLKNFTFSYASQS
jgi:hypothetical protein